MLVFFVAVIDTEIETVRGIGIETGIVIVKGTETVTVTGIAEGIVVETGIEIVEIDTVIEAGTMDWK